VERAGLEPATPSLQSPLSGHTRLVVRGNKRDHHDFDNPSVARLGTCRYPRATRLLGRGHAVLLLSKASS
jgi:hypothetical protein